MRRQKTISFLALILFLSACGKSDDGSAVGANTLDVKRIVTTGNSLSFNNQTGGVNDLALQSTGLPAVAYYDKSAPVSGTVAVGALKYAYMMENGAWEIEVVDANYGTVACGTALSFCIGAPNAAAGSVASIIKLAFKSTGQPAIAYVYGPSAAGAGAKQLRLAERDASGKWTVSVAMATTTAATAITVDPLKGVTLAFDSANRPHITVAHYSAVILNSTLRYLFRASSGSWTQTDIAPIVTGAGTITVLGQGANQNGFSICSTNGLPISTSMVVDAIAGVGRPILNRCTALDSAGGCSAWSTVNIASGCSAAGCFSAGVLAANNAGQRTDLVINPANNRPVFGIYNTTSTGLFVAELPNACGVAQPTAAGGWGAAVSVAAGSAGLNGFRLAASATRFFASFATLTTNVALSVFSGAWFAAGHVVETTTVGAEGVGFAYDAANDMLYASYAALPGAAANAFGNDIKVAAVPPGELVTGGLTGSLALSVIDTLVTAFPTTAIPMLSSARAPDGTVGFAYFYQDVTPADSKLYYGVRGGTALSPTFATNVVANFIEGAAAPALAGSFPSLAYDSTSNPIVAFYNGVVADQQLVVARSTNRGVTFSHTIVDDTSAQIGQFPSLATSGSAIGVAYYDVTNTGLKFARYTPASGWRRYAVDGMAGTGSCGSAADDSGRHAKLILTSTGQPVIVYQSNGVNLKLAYATAAITDTSFTWSCLALDPSAAARGEGIDIALDASGVPHIVHFDATAGSVRYVTCGGDVASCVSAGPGGFTSAILNGTGTVASVVTKPSISINSLGTMFVTFHSSSFQGLALASRASGATAWSMEYIDSAQTGASFISAGGQYGALLINDSNQPMVFYRSNENWLKYFSREIF